MKSREAGNKASTSKPKIDPPPRDNLKNVPDPKGKERREANSWKYDQGEDSFNMEAEIVKIKIYVPLTELLKNSEYHSKIVTVLQPSGEISTISDSLNLEDDRITILFSIHVDEPYN